MRLKTTALKTIPVVADLSNGTRSVFHSSNENRRVYHWTITNQANVEIETWTDPEIRSLHRDLGVKHLSVMPPHTINRREALFVIQ